MTIASLRPSDGSARWPASSTRWRPRTRADAGGDPGGRPTPLGARALQVALTLPLAGLTALQWLTWLALDKQPGRDAAAAVAGAPELVGGAGRVHSVHHPLGRMGIAVIGARLLTAGLRPGTYQRGGSAHLRVWLAERLADASGAENQAGAPWLVYYARALGNSVGKGWTCTPLPGHRMLTLGHRSSVVEPEVDLTGHWIDGDLFHLGRITVGNDATIGSRTMLLPGAVVGKDADVAASSSRSQEGQNGQYWKGSPAVKSAGPAIWPDHRPPRAALEGDLRHHLPLLLGALPLGALAASPGGAGLGGAGHRDTARGRAHSGTVDTGGDPDCRRCLRGRDGGGRTGALDRSEGGYHPVRSRVGWQLWATERLMDAARPTCSRSTPGCSRRCGSASGAKVGRNTEISTALMTPKFTVIEDGAFPADDTMVASYELGGGWIHIAKATVGKRVPG